MAVYTVTSGAGTEANIGSSISTSMATGSLSAIWATTAQLCPAFINELAFGPSGPPNATDCSIYYALLNTTTAAPTGGTSGTQKSNPLLRASGTSGMVNPTGGATVVLTTPQYNIGLNQRASYRWTAIPGQEIITPATNLVGMALCAKSATYASTITSTLQFFE